MNEVNAGRTCLHCEREPALTEYGLCETCNQVKALRRVYRVGRGGTPEWEAHLLHLTVRAKQRLPLFEDHYVPPRRPRRGRRRRRGAGRVPRVFRATPPRRELEE
jgi:hypothetical protein